MAYDFNGSSQYLSLASPVATAAPLTMACFFNADSLTATGMLISMYSSGGGALTGFHLACAGAAAGDPIRAAVGNLGTFGTASTSAGYSTGVWQHAAGVFSASNSRTVYLDAGSSGSDTTSITPGTLNNTVVGARVASGSLSNVFDGRIAEPAIWNAALTADEVAALAKGVSPAKIRPESLVFYPPLIRDLSELIAGVSLSATAAPTVAAHPRVYGL